MNVRIASADDVNDLLELNTCFHNITTFEAIKKSLVENNREIVCIAFCDNTAIGYCSGLIVRSMCYSDNHADIEALYVKDEYRGKGVGKALLKYLENELIARGIYHIHIITHATNTAAQSLYESSGYAKTGEILLDKTLERQN